MNASDPPLPDTPAPEARDLVSEILFTTPARRRTGARYAIAVLVVIAAFSMRYVVHPDLLHRLPFTFFVPAVLIAAWYGGLGPGVVAMLGGLLLGDYFFLEPHRAFGPLSAVGRLSIGAYTLSCVFGIALFQLMHVTHRRLLKQIESPGPNADRKAG